LVGSGDASGVDYGRDTIDAAIVGGGIAGLYTAWRLNTSPKPPRIGLFECSERLGGRIDTFCLPTSGPPTKVEFGAMRFTACMVFVASLLKHFGIQTETFPGSAVRSLYLRGVQIPVSGGGSSQSFPYRLASGEPPDPVALTEKVLNGAVPNATTLTAAQWLQTIRTGRFRGRPLWAWGFWNMAEELISNEAYDFLFNGFGLQSVLANFNGATGIRMMALILNDYVNGRTYRPVDGWGSLTDKIEQSVKAASRCRIETGWRLVDLKRAAGGVELVFDTRTGTRSITAGRVVLAMPRRALELLDFGDLFPEQQRFSRELKILQKLSRVGQVPAFKLIMVYSEPWWQKTCGWSDGVSVTDLPIRQLFYGVGQGGDAASNARVLLASYCDSESATFWSGLANLGPDFAISASIGEVAETRGGNLVNAIERQLQVLLQISTPLPKPVWIGYMDWSKDPFGAAWHEWLPGIDVLQAIPDMRHPFADLPIFVCGEAYSWFQGWIEGALMSAEHVIEDYFSLPRPNWLPVDYDLGP
jgi:lysine 2-monooxygenase